MNTDTLNEVIACLPKGKTHYRYFKGAYAPKMLEMLLPEQASVHAIKKTRFKQLLHHPLTKPIIGACGSGMVHRNLFETVWQEPSQPFLLTLNRWGGNRDRDWHQTSRFGENLVLQLNMPKEHQRQYARFISSSGETLNGRWSSHPVQLPDDNSSFRETLAWSRIDIDFNTNEALIEEIQSDGARYVARWKRRFINCGCKRCIQRLHYIDWIEPYRASWSEAMLSATIEFVRKELGIERVFLHTAKSGWKVKKMSSTWHAPRSLYSDLPKKFTFKRTYAAPEFLLETKCYQKLIRKQPDIDFFQLSMDELKHTLGE